MKRRRSGSTASSAKVEEVEDEAEKKKTTAAAAKKKEEGVKKPSAAFVALTDKFLSSGRVTSSRLNLKPVVVVARSGGGDAERRNLIEKAQGKSDLYDGSKAVAPPLVPEKAPKKKTLGRGWFDMEPAVLDDNLKRDMKMIQMRNYIDPKRFYKNPDKPKAVLHVGTVIEGLGEYKSSRLTNKERKTTILAEILADKQVKQYTKRKYLELQEAKPKRRGGGKKKKGKR